MDKLIVKCLLAGLILCASSFASAKDIKVGLALSGGGARGFAHIGVLKVLEQAGVKIDYIAGTSMGSIIGGLFASGMSAAEIETLVKKIQWDDVLTDYTPRSDLPIRSKQQEQDNLVYSSAGFRNGEIRLPAGLQEGQRLGLLLKSVTLAVSGVTDFRQLPIPFSAVSTNIVDGQRVVLDSGDLATAMRASMAVPGAFSPVEYKGKLLVDGGLAENLPVSVVREMGADIVIAIDISTPLVGKSKMTSVIAITEQLTSIMTRANTEASLKILKKDDILLVPDLGEVSTSSFSDGALAITSGEQSARSMIDRIKKLAQRQAGNKVAYKKGIVKNTTDQPITKVELDNQSRFSDDELLRYISQRPGELLDLVQLEDDITRLYGLGYFQKISYDIIRRSHKNVLIIRAEEKAWGPNYVQGGLSLTGDLQGDSNLNVALSYTQTGINDSLAEWRSLIQLGDTSRLFTEYYHPFALNGGLFVNPSFEYTRYPLNRYINSVKEGEYRIEKYSLDLAGGKTFGEWGELRTGLSLSAGRLDLVVGDPSLGEGSFKDSALFARFISDTLDNRYFPRKGWQSRIELRSYQAGLGGDESYNQFSLSLLKAASWGKTHVTTGFRSGITLSDNAPVQSLYSLGGFANLSGFDKDELVGQNSFVGVLSLYRHWANVGIANMFYGMTLEAGNIWDDNSHFGNNLLLAGSTYIGIDSLIGPLYIGLGIGEGGRYNGFLYLGKPF